MFFAACMTFQKIPERMSLKSQEALTFFLPELSRAYSSEGHKRALQPNELKKKKRKNLFQRRDSLTWDKAVAVLKLMKMTKLVFYLYGLCVNTVQIDFYSNMDIAHSDVF